MGRPGLDTVESSQREVPGGLRCHAEGFSLCISPKPEVLSLSESRGKDPAEGLQGGGSGGGERPG